MQTNLHPDILATDKGKRADSILRACVHCGFCNATCPTYQLLGDELDGPRGRIYLIKDLLESNSVNQRAQTHLDRCLTCRSCETTCPSGVAYGELLEIGREHLAIASPYDEKVNRSWFDRALRSALVWLVPNATRFRRLASLGNLFRWLLPSFLRRPLPRLEASASRLHVDTNPSTVNEVGSVLLIDGCVQKAATPSTNEHLEQLLQNHNVRVERMTQDGCCGGATLHLGDTQGALLHMRRLLDQVAPYLDQVDAILSSASGCGVTLKDYPRLLAEDPDYRAQAEKFANKLMDVSEYLGRLSVMPTSHLPNGLNPRQSGSALASAEQAAVAKVKVAWHSPCTLQHGQKLTGGVEKLLLAAGYDLVPVADPHICCGSAGTYAITQPKLSEQLQTQKVAALQAAGPDIIATANVGCQLHIAAAAQVPVVHWLKLLE